MKKSERQRGDFQTLFFEMLIEVKRKEAFLYRRAEIELLFPEKSGTQHPKGGKLFEER